MSVPEDDQPLRGRSAEERDRARVAREQRRTTGEHPAVSSGPRPRRGRLAVLAIAVLVAVFALWFLNALFQPFHGDGSGRVVIEIPSGASSRQIGDLLAGRGVVASGFFFDLRARLEGDRGRFHAGHFVMREDMSYLAALNLLTNDAGMDATVSVTVPEGVSRRTTAALAAQAGLTGSYLAESKRSALLRPQHYGAPAGTPSLEGFLFPDTYDLNQGASSRDLVAQQLEEFKRQIATVDLSYARRHQLTVYDVLTIASMIERETSIPRERPLVAAVIYNRLHDGMALGIDSTLRYALNDFDHPLTQTQLQLDTPYNTRLHKGLPPTPIGNPGLAAIVAAAHPARVDYLYYVAKPGTCNENAFSSTYAQFLRDAAAYQQARAAAGGREPTTCPG
jgi:uncharacterized YceG family protein